MAYLRSAFVVLVLLLLSELPVLAQLNEPEFIFLDSNTVYPTYGFLIGDDYFIGVAESTCKEAFVWRMDSSMDIILRKQLKHLSYEISDVLDMRIRDSVIEVMTWQLQYDDISGDSGIKWYSLNLDLEVLDSFYIPVAEVYDGVMTDSSLVIQTWSDSLLWISKNSRMVEHSRSFLNSHHFIAHSDSLLLAWKNEEVVLFDSSRIMDTLETSQTVLDVTFSSDAVFVLTENEILQLQEDSELGWSVMDTISAPLLSQSIAYHPQASYLIVATDSNAVFFYDDSLRETGTIQLFYDPVYQEEVRYQPLVDGSIIRLGTTSIKVDRGSRLLHGPGYGMIQLFDQEYSEDEFDRSDLSLENLSLSDPYYESDQKQITKDTIYIITKDYTSRIHWSIYNAGPQQINSGLVETNTLWGSNCASGNNSNFFTGASLASGDNLTGEFSVYEHTDFPHGWESDRLVYTAHPNGHYDADFSNNLKSFSFRYIVSSSRKGLDPALVSISPNPAMEYFVLENSTDLFDRVELCDLQGRLIWTQKIPRQINRIHIPLDCPPGLYIVRIQGTGTSLVKKLLVFQ